jgi:hypothetical protein
MDELAAPRKSDSSLRREFFEVIDLAENELGRRFDQTGIKVASQRERLLLQEKSALTSMI